MGTSRIRYEKHPEPETAAEGWKQSRHLYPGNSEHMWRVFINESRFEFKLINTTTHDTIEYANKTKNLNVLKRKIREALTSVGVKLTTDVRKKRNVKKNADTRSEVLPKG